MNGEGPWWFEAPSFKIVSLRLAFQQSNSLKVCFVYNQHPELIILNSKTRLIMYADRFDHLLELLK